MYVHKIKRIIVSRRRSTSSILRKRINGSGREGKAEKTAYKQVHLPTQVQVQVQ